MTRNKNFAGVFMRDELPHSFGKHSSLVMNIDGNNGPGTHWVCIVNQGDSDNVEFFDSYGLPPPEEAVTFMRTTKKPIAFNTSQIQALGSILCGYYCMLFITKRSQSKTMYDVLYKFNQTPNEKNPKIIHKYFSCSVQQ